MDINAPDTNVEANIGEIKKLLFITRLIHIALVVGVAMFGTATLVITARQISFKPLFNPLTMTAVALCLAAVVFSYVVAYFYRKFSAPPATINAALHQYQTFCILRWAVIEGGVLFAGVTMLVAKNILPILVFIVSAAFLLSRYPSQNEFMSVTRTRRNPPDKRYPITPF